MLVWRLLDEGINGRLEVGCDYGLDSRGRMNMSLRIHRLLPDEKMPSDPEGLVGLLQRAMPRELFDPNEHALETTVSVSISCLVMGYKSRTKEWVRSALSAEHPLILGMAALRLTASTRTFVEASDRGKKGWVR